MPSTDFEQASRAINLHQSSISAIQGCARQWALQYVAGLPTPESINTVGGTLTHAALEAHERTRMEGGPAMTIDEMCDVADTLLAELADKFLDEDLAGLEVKVARGKTVTGLEALRAQAHSAINVFWSSRLDGEDYSARDLLLTWTPLAQEAYLSGPVVPGARDLGGTVDGMYLDADGVLRVVDFKTAKQLSWWREVGHHSAQATHYSVLALLFGADLVGFPILELPPMDFIVLRRDPSIRSDAVAARRLTYQPTHLDVVALRERVLAAQATIDEGVFLPDPTYQWCRPQSCPFFDRCQLGGRELAGPFAELVVKS